MDDTPDRCPRCGKAFRCGIGDAAPCPCTTLALAPEALAAIAQRFSGCLCLDCLREWPWQAPPADAASPARSTAG